MPSCSPLDKNIPKLSFFFFCLGILYFYKNKHWKGSLDGGFFQLMQQGNSIINYANQYVISVRLMRMISQSSIDSTDVIAFSFSFHGWFEPLGQWKAFTVIDMCDVADVIFLLEVFCYVSNLEFLFHRVELSFWSSSMPFQEITSA